MSITRRHLVTAGALALGGLGLFRASKGRLPSPPMRRQLP